MIGSYPNNKNKINKLNTRANTNANAHVNAHVNARVNAHVNIKSNIIFNQYAQPFEPNVLTFNTSKKICLGLGLVGLGIGSFALLRYKTSKPNEWLVRTGLGISGIQIGKKFVQWPFQNVKHIRTHIRPYKFYTYAISKEKYNFSFHAVFTIGLKNETMSLEKFSRYVLNQSEVNDLIFSVLEEESRTLASSLSIEEIFSKVEFKSGVICNVQKQLDQYGLEMHNAKIENFCVEIFKD